MIKKCSTLFTSESVSEGHPDKVCDQISDAILDECLRNDANAHVACEVFATKGVVVVGGEISANQHPDYEKIVRKTLLDIGYDDESKGMDANKAEIHILVNQQSSDINNAVRKDDPLNNGAGDQGFVFGYATNETKGYMPLGISIAHKLVRTASNKRKENEFLHARPDMKSQVTIDYENPKKPRITKVLMSVQHDEDVNMDEFKKYIYEEIMLPVIKSFKLNSDFEALINPSGRFVIGGPLGDTGLTGRKIIVDTYGGSARHGGGAFSGKDPSKVDRSGAYMARYIAKNLVAAGVADRLEVQIGYAIGVSEPVSIGIVTFGTKKYSDEIVLNIINKIFDCRPGAISKNFNLLTPNFKYLDLASYGHFGRPDLDLPWEKLDKVAEIKKLLQK